MTTLYPRLRSDLVITQLDKEGGRGYCQISTPDAGTKLNLNLGAYHALLNLDGETSLDGWIETVMISNPAVKRESLQKLFNWAWEMGLLEEGADDEDDDSDDDETTITPIKDITGDRPAALNESVMAQAAPGAPGVGGVQGPAPSDLASAASVESDRRTEGLISTDKLDVTADRSAGIGVKSGHSQAVATRAHAGADAMSGPVDTSRLSLSSQVMPVEAGTPQRQGPIAPSAHDVEEEEALAAEEDSLIAAAGAPADAENEVDAGDGHIRGDQIYEEAQDDVESDPAAVKRRWKRRLSRALRILVVPAVLFILSIAVWIPLTITYPCKVKPLQRSVVRAPMDGVISTVEVNEGQSVEKEALLAEIANADLKLDVAKSEAELERATAELELLKKGQREEEIDRVRARVSGLRRQVGIASTRVKRLKGLVRKGVAPRAELESASAELASVSGQLKQANAELNLVQAGARVDDLKKVEAEIRGISAQLDVNRKLLVASQIRAPMAGVVTTPKPKELINTRVAQGKDLFEIALLDKMRVQVQVAERDFDVLDIGQDLTMRVASFPTRAFAGKVARIPLRVEVVDGQPVIPVEGEIENEDGLLRPNMTGYAKISGERTPLLGILFRRLVRYIRVRFLI